MVQKKKHPGDKNTAYRNSSSNLFKLIHKDEYEAVLPHSDATFQIVLSSSLAVILNYIT